jgi:hypothetical protein
LDTQGTILRGPGSFTICSNAEQDHLHPSRIISTITPFSGTRVARVGLEPGCSGIMIRAHHFEHSAGGQVVQKLEEPTEPSRKQRKKDRVSRYARACGDSKQVRAGPPSIWSKIGLECTWAVIRAQSDQPEDSELLTCILRIIQ